MKRADKIRALKSERAKYLAMAYTAVGDLDIMAAAEMAERLRKQIEKEEANSD